MALAAAAALAGITPMAFALDAVVTGCHDGDTCTIVSPDRGTVRVRIHGIDTPELDQPYGTEARALTLHLVLGQHVDVRPAGQSHDRLVADLVLPDGTDLGSALVSAGAAWVEPRYSTDRGAPARQADAQRRHAGLWADRDAVPPWTWRAAHRHRHEARGRWIPWPFYVAIGRVSAG